MRPRLTNLRHSRVSLVPWIIEELAFRCCKFWFFVVILMRRIHPLTALCLFLCRDAQRFARDYRRRSWRPRSWSTSHFDRTNVQSDLNCSRCRKTCDPQEDYRTGALFVRHPHQSGGKWETSCRIFVLLSTLLFIFSFPCYELATRSQVHQEGIGRYRLPGGGKADQGNERWSGKACVQRIQDQLRRNHCKGRHHRWSSK